jgi:hypothetical protein
VPPFWFLLSLQCLPFIPIPTAIINASAASVAISTGVQVVIHRQVKHATVVIARCCPAIFCFCQLSNIDHLSRGERCIMLWRKIRTSLQV